MAILRRCWHSFRWSSVRLGLQPAVGRIQCKKRERPFGRRLL